MPVYLSDNDPKPEAPLETALKWWAAALIVTALFAPMLAAMLR